MLKRYFHDWNQNCFCYILRFVVCHAYYTLRLLPKLYAIWALQTVSVVENRNHFQIVRSRMQLICNSRYTNYTCEPTATGFGLELQNNCMQHCMVSKYLLYLTSGTLVRTKIATDLHSNHKVISI